MNRTCRVKILTVLVLAFLVAGGVPAYGKAATTTFTGKIVDIRKATALGLGEHGKFITIKLDSRPLAEFQMSTDDAVHYGLIEATGVSQVMTPKSATGLGWKVKVTCPSEYKGKPDAPVYQVKSLERIDDKN